MKEINSLAIVKKYLVESKIDQKTFGLLSDRIKLVDEGIRRIKKITGLDYPQFYIEPNLLVATSSIEYDQYSILYARTIPICTKENRIRVVIQLSAPLVLYGLKGTIHAVLGHEFLHYLNILKNIINLEITSDTISNTLFESSFTDNEKAIDFRKVFKGDSHLQKLISQRFENGFKDERLDTKTEKLWIKRGLPVQRIRIEDNYIKLPFTAMANTLVEDSIKNEILKFS